ncbi:protein transport protein bos1 [Coemansia sp. RSA 552]|nr:protein transport protein bos1 [Coemansia sp. RSA 552]
MTSEYNAAQRVLHLLKQNVSDFELSLSTADTAVTEAAIAQSLQTLSKRIGEYRILGRQEANERKRKTMLDRAAVMAEDHEQLKRRFEKHQQHRSERTTGVEERNELFQRQPGAGGARVQQTDTAIVMDPQEEQDFWMRSEQALDGYLAQGVASLTNLREQKGMLQDAHARIMNADNTLGLSRSVITLINRRTTQDKLILAGGMAFTCACIYFLLSFIG